MVPAQAPLLEAYVAEAAREAGEPAPEGATLAAAVAALEREARVCSLGSHLMWVLWGVAMEVPKAPAAGAGTGEGTAERAGEQEAISFGYVEYALERLNGFYLRCADIDARYA